MAMSVFCVVLWVWHRPATLVKADALPSEPEILMSMIACSSVIACPLSSHDQHNKQYHLSVFIRHILLKKQLNLYSYVLVVSFVVDMMLHHRAVAGTL